MHEISKVISSYKRIFATVNFAEGCTAVEERYDSFQFIFPPPTE